MPVALHDFPLRHRGTGADTAPERTRSTEDIAGRTRPRRTGSSGARRHRNPAYAAGPAAILGALLTAFPPPRMRPARALIDLAAFRHNYRLARRIHGGRALAVIKANAYGHG